mmetsp:Transcript_11487/g.37766  ORF Transcript_11487/g.37766 Transcript_11487/m.37766 type:complete len:235 (-) Transcript_11487:451-1155(-)
MALTFLSTPFALIVQLGTAPLPALRPPAARVLLSADASELMVREAAMRVVAAANKFGSTQGEAAAEWVMEAMSSRSGEVDCEELLGKQLALFDECLVEDSANCEELDEALSSLEAQLKQGEAGPLDIFGQSKMDRAAARVRTAAAKFGADYGKVAEQWIADVRGSGSEVSPFALLEQQMSLFGECLLDVDDEEGGGASERCEELSEALGALQLSLGVKGRVVATAKNAVAPERK